MSKHNGPKVTFWQDLVLIEGQQHIWTTNEGDKVLIHFQQFRELIHKDKFQERLTELQANPELMGYPNKEVTNETA